MTIIEHDEQAIPANATALELVVGRSLPKLTNVCQSAYSLRELYPGCTCQYGPDTPSWYSSVETCPLHKNNYRADQIPDWWIENEAKNKIAEQREARRQKHWWGRL